MKKYSLLMSCVLAASFGLVACNGNEYGKTVEQGRCVAYTKDKVVFVEDSNVNPKMKADFSKGTVLTFSMPTDPKEIGPEPEAGNLIS
ncbi:MAG: hypothetical protein IK079_04130, partial [Desulfovibrio sp.]|nr:hypothetical protein [Desulfovibrio sp.]